MSKSKKKKDMLKDLLVSQLQMLRIRLMENIADIDKYTKIIGRRFKKEK